MPQSLYKDRQPLSEKNWDHSRFVQRVIRAAFGEPIQESELPASLDLTGTISQGAEEVWKATILDANLREHGRALYATTRKTLRWSYGGVVTGEEEKIAPQANEMAYRQKLLQTLLEQNIFAISGQPNEYEEMLKQIEDVARSVCCLDMHSHGIWDSFVSPADMVNLLGPQNTIVGSLVLTSLRKILLLRTAAARSLTESEGIILQQELRDQYTKEFDEFERQMKSSLPGFTPTLEQRKLKHSAIIRSVIMAAGRERGFAFYEAEDGYVFKRVG